MSVRNLKQNPQLRKWLASRRAAGRRINPEKALVTWEHGLILDPYGVHPDLSEEEDCVGRVYFAKNPQSKIWVSFDNIPQNVQSKIWKKIKIEVGQQQ